MNLMTSICLYGTVFLYTTIKESVSSMFFMEVNMGVHVEEKFIRIRTSWEGPSRLYAYVERESFQLFELVYYNLREWNLSRSGNKLGEFVGCNYFCSFLYWWLVSFAWPISTFGTHISEADHKIDGLSSNWNILWNCRMKQQFSKLIVQIFK